MGSDELIRIPLKNTEDVWVIIAISNYLLKLLEIDWLSREKIIRSRIIRLKKMNRLNNSNQSNFNKILLFSE